jgi:hypothetical protein
MKRMLLATTALAALVVGGTAIAQDSSSSAESSMMSSEMPSSMMSSSEMPADSSMMSETSMIATPETATPVTRTPVDILAGYTIVDSDMLTSRIINMPVYNGTANDAQQVGTINDLILNQSGEVVAVVIGVGGFLGLGEKQVAVDFSALQFTVAADNTERYILDTTAEELTQAPDFQIVDDNPADGSSMMDSSMSSAP